MTITIQLSAIPTDTGFDILAISEGVAKGHDLKFSADVLKRSLPLWDKVPVCLDHPNWLTGPSIRNFAGSLNNPSWDETEKGIRLTLLPGGPAAPDLVSLRDAARSDPAIAQAIGFSAVLQLVAKRNGDVESITRIFGVDAVINPARGGKFLQALHSKGGITMPEIQDPTEDAALNAETRAVAILEGGQEAANQAKEQADAVKTIRLQMCRDLLSTSLAAAKLPPAVTDRIQKRFSVQLDNGIPFEPADLQAEIDDQKAMLSELTIAANVQGPGRIGAMYSSDDQLRAAVADMFEVDRDPGLDKVRPARLSGIRELYHILTGDYEMHGGFFADRVQLATTSDFAGLVKNALNKAVSKNWDQLGKAGYDWWENIVEVQNFTSLNDITGILVGTVGTLPSVSEGAEYTELAVGDSPETASFVKYGGYIPLTLELIDRDETRKLKAYPRELANAAIRTLSKEISDVFTDNSDVGPTMADTGALFNSTAVTTAGGHANLLTTALSADQWETVATAVYNQPMLIKQAASYYGTGNKMAIEPRYCLVPRALKKTAWDAFINAWSTTDNKHAENLLKGAVVPIVVPHWTDTNNWAAVCDPAVAPAIIVGTRFGIKPEIYIAGNETDPAVFMNDEHRIKVRHFNAVLVQDFRPLHKSNVA